MSLHEGYVVEFTKKRALKSYQLLPAAAPLISLLVPLQISAARSIFVLSRYERKNLIFVCHCKAAVNYMSSSGGKKVENKRIEEERRSGAS